ncbi:MAG: hypothetical protein ABIP36_00300 [Acidimicrobiales bacterium]
MDWAAPDVTAADGPPAPAGAPWRPSAPPPPSLPRLGPRTASDILDGGFAILKRAPATIIALTAVFVVPVQALSAWLNRGADGVDLDALLEQSDTSFDIGGSGLDSASAAVLQVGSMLALVFVAAALARLVSAWQVGHDLSLRELLRGSVTRAWPLLASWVLVHLLEAVSLIGLVLPLAVMTWFLVTAPVIGAEGLGPIDAMRRSARLTARRFWVVLGLALLCLLVETLFESAIGLLPTLLSGVLGTDGVGWLLPAVIGILTSLITIPVVAGITVLIYLDLRVRTEGLDLELGAIAAFPSDPAGRPT